MTDKTNVVVGASLAGARAAEGMRDAGFDGAIVLIGEEEARPYERPPLSKGFLRGEEEIEKAYVHDEGFYADNDIDLRTGTEVVEVDSGASVVRTADGDVIAYDKLLIATGSEPRRLPAPGEDLTGVRYLRSADDSAGLRAAIEAAGHAVVVGAGWIGSEVAASARQMGADVTVVEMGEVPLEGVVGREVGEYFADLHRRHGVHLRTGATVEGIVGHDAVEGVRVAGGDVIECDLVVVGVGVTPRTGLAEAAGLAVDNGIVVDEHLESTVPGIYAAGDVASAYHPLYGTHLRVEHWSNARNQGFAAGRSMVEPDVVYDRIPYFFSDQYDMGMEYSGYATDWDQVVRRGAGDEFVVFWLKEGRVLAGMNVNVWDVAEEIQELVRSGRTVDVDRLADPSVPIGDV